MNKTVKTAVTIVIALVVTMFLFRHDKAELGTWIGVGSMMAIIFVAMFVPVIGDFLVARPKLVFWSGVGIAASSLILPLVWFAASGHVPAAGERDPMGSVAVYAIMVGICLAILPRSIAVQRRTQPALERTKASPETAHDDRFQGIAEGWRANVETVRRILPFLRIAGPWIAIVVAAWLAGTYLDGLWPQYSGEFRLRPWTSAFRLISMAIAIPTALVGWHRYLLNEDVPRFSLPDWNVLRYLWRLWMIVILTTVAMQVAALNTKDVARFIGTANADLVFAILYWGGLALIIFSGSQFALVFPAVALGRRDFAGMDSLVMTKPLGVAFRLGFVLSLLPFAGLGYIAYRILTRIMIDGDAYFLFGNDGWFQADMGLFVMTGLAFLALASCATYQSNVYARQVADSKNSRDTIRG